MIFLLLFSFPGVYAQSRKTENLIIVTLDGFRWQELFEGADSSILFNKKYTDDPAVGERFWGTTMQQRRARLLPFFWNVIGDQGQLYGNRNFNNRVDCSNPHWFSYPGYSELLTGLVDRRVRSNNKIKNPNPTVLECINRHEAYQGKVAAFSTWDVIPYVIRATDAKIPVNTGTPEARTAAFRSGDLFLTNHRQSFNTSYERTGDSFTFYLAFDFLKQEKPNVLYISFDETDSYAHGGHYSQYLRAAHHADKMISELWRWIQADPQYKDRTTLLITTDHGRGKKTPASWKKHGRLTSGSGQVWFAVIGPDTPGTGEIRTASTYFQKQFAKTAAAFLGIDFTSKMPVGDAIEMMRFIPELTTR